MGIRPNALITILLLAVAPLTGLQPARAEADTHSLLVLAAASLTDVLPSVAQAWKKSHPGINVELSFDATSRVALQLEQGAPADVFFSADPDWMDELQKKGAILPATRRDLLGNEIVLIVPAGSPSPRSAAELKDPVYKKIALSGENVPISRYAQAALMNLHVWASIQPKVVRGEDVRTNLKWVEEKNVDAGVVYRTDAAGDPRVKIAFAFPKNTYPPVVYPGAVVTRSKARELAGSFLDFCAGKKAQAIFRKAGFTPLGRRQPGQPARGGGK